MPHICSPAPSTALRPLHRRQRLCRHRRCAPSPPATCIAMLSLCHEASTLPSTSPLPTLPHPLMHAGPPTRKPTHPHAHPRRHPRPPPPCAPAPAAYGAAVAAPSFNLTVSVGGPKHPGRTVPRKLRVYSSGDRDRGNITCNTNPLPNPQHATDDQAFLDSLESPPPCAPAPATTPFYTPMVPNTPLSDELDTLLKVCT